jgi:hypothetical protein
MYFADDALAVGTDCVSWCNDRLDRAFEMAIRDIVVAGEPDSRQP